MNILEGVLSPLCRAVVDSLCEAVLLCGENGQVVWVNLAAGELLDLCDKDLIGKHIDSIIATDGGGSLHALVRQNDWARAKSGLVKSNHDSPVRVSWQRLRDHKGLDFVLVLDDRAELHALERELLQSQKMDLMGQLTGGIAHDFNNLLGAMSGSIAAIKRGIGADTKLAKRVELLERTVGSAKELSSQLLGFSKKEGLQRADVNLEELMEEGVRLLSRMFRKEIEIELVGSKDVWSVCVNRSQILSCILNLGVNAKDALEGCGKIRFSRENIDFSHDPQRCAEMGIAPGKFVRVMIEDSGEGISMKDASHIFEPFFTTKEAGTGLGLAMASRIATDHGGVLYLEACRGDLGGACFCLLLPAKV